MEKIYGIKERQDCLMRVGQSKWILFYGFGKDDETSDTGWEFRHTFNYKPHLSEIKELVISAINSFTSDKIVKGFVWNNQPVYLSIENQLNYAAIERCKDIQFPLVLKINEQVDGTPIYQTFENAEDFHVFSQAIAMHITETVQKGWYEKDNVDWSAFTINDIEI